MITIWKYPLQITERQVLEIPINTDRRSFAYGLKLRGLQVQDRHPVMWVEVNDRLPKILYEILVSGTGHAMQWLIGPEAPEYLGTVQLDGFVWHYYGRILK